MPRKKEPNPVGRPTSYSPAILKLSEDYLNGLEPGKLPQIAGLARHIKIARSTVYLWAENKNNHEFSDIVGDILAEQEVRLIDNGLDGSYNASITKLMLGKHGYHDKQETEHSGSISFTERDEKCL